MAFALDLIKSDEGEATRYILEDGSYLIGRGENCALQLPDPGVSERHALLLLRGQTARLEDLHSANGTYINGVPVDGIVSLRKRSTVLRSKELKSRPSHGPKRPPPLRQTRSPACAAR